jgi:predicted kinase
MTNPVCTVMVGLPALGKSTFIEKIVAVEDAWVYSTDQHIERCARQNDWSYDQAFPEFIGQATKKMNEMLSVSIRSRQNIVWDQTNLSAGKRQKIINRMKQSGYTVNCICLLPPEPGHLDDQKVWAFRLNNRPGKTIPQHVIANMFETFVVPTLAEGFDVIRYYNMYGIEIDYEPDS